MEVWIRMISQLQEAFTQAVERAGVSTVNVSSARGPPGPPFGSHPPRGFGSGIVMDAEGHILTNHHVVARAESIIVTLVDGRVLSGAVVGGDEETDIAVVKVDAGELKPAEFGDSDGLKVGQPVLAIGNPLGLAGGPTVTSGVVSSLRRSLQLGNGDGLKVVQTDAAVNPGNSGGPLVDLEGKVVAINTATIPYAEGIGFAVPINLALDIARQIIDHGRVQRAWLGVVGYDVNRRVAFHYGLTAGRGIFVTEVTQGSPAEAAGLRVGDVITAAGDSPLVGVGDLVAALRSRTTGSTLDMEVERNGRRIRIQATLAARPF
jgi:serine protease Do